MACRWAACLSHAAEVAAAVAAGADWATEGLLTKKRRWGMGMEDQPGTDRGMAAARLSRSSRVRVGLGAALPCARFSRTLGSECVAQMGERLGSWESGTAGRGAGRVRRLGWNHSESELGNRNGTTRAQGSQECRDKWVAEMVGVDDLATADRRRRQGSARKREEKGSCSCRSQSCRDLVRTRSWLPTTKVSGYQWRAHLRGAVCCCCSLVHLGAQGSPTRRYSRQGRKRSSPPFGSRTPACLRRLRPREAFRPSRVERDLPHSISKLCIRGSLLAKHPTPPKWTWQKSEFQARTGSEPTRRCGLCSCARDDAHLPDTHPRRIGRRGAPPSN